MFSHEGPGRSIKKNAALAGYLALVAGFVNSGGFVLIGSFTSHVTGSLGRLSTELASGDAGAALFAGLLVVTFFAGAFSASLLLETNAFERTSRAYGVALVIEGVLIAAFALVAGRSHNTRALDAEAAILCFAMGMQNSLVTRLSGSVVRTTHLTGVVTDLGIEAARWYRWHRVRLRQIPLLLAGRSPPVRPAPTQALLLLTITAAFTSGAILGALTTLRTGHWAMLEPACAILVASAYAFLQPGGEPSKA